MKKQLKAEMDVAQILQSNLYIEFDKLSLEQKEIFVSYFQMNIEKLKLKTNEADKNNRTKQIYSTHSGSCERQVFRLQQINYSKSYFISPAEIRFFKQVDEEIQKFQNQVLNSKHDNITIESLDDPQLPLQFNQIQTSMKLGNNQDEISLSAMLNENENMRNNEQEYAQESLFQRSSAQVSEKGNYFSANQKNNNPFKKYDIIKIESKPIMKLSKFLIEVLQENGETLIKKEPYKFLSQTGPCIKLNQLFGQKEVDSLNQGYRMLNSSIINAYVNHLMIKDEEQYYSLSSISRQKYNRLYIFNSEFLTDCSIDNFDLTQELMRKKQLYIWLKYLNNFKEIQYRFDKIYKKIGFIVNVKNYHWYFAEVNLQKKQIIIFDSLFRIESSFYNLKQVLSYLFGQILQQPQFELNIVIYDFPKQSEGLSCGYYACVAAEYLSQTFEQPRNMKNLDDMKSILRELLN